MTQIVDIPSIVQVIGCIYQQPSLFENQNYFFNEEDFTEDFHRVLFGSMFNLYKIFGTKQFTINVIEDYLEQRPTALAVYRTNKGREYLQKLSETINLSTFDYYYQRMKKMTLLRMYQNIGMDMSWLYDADNILNVKKKQAQEEWLDNTPLEEIAEVIDKKITDIRLRYVDDSNTEFQKAGDDIDELIDRLQQNPEYGCPLFGPLINSVTRGARLKKFYLRSAATGVGKTRAMIADACYMACDELYNKQTGQWEKNNTKEPTLYITTEQEVDEVQTMMLAFLANVNESHIVYNTYENDELERVRYAAQVLKNSPLVVKRLPDFSLKDIENTIKYSIIEWKVKYVFFDYLHTSMKILSEVSSKTGIKGLREDNVLFMISVRLKDLCAEYGVFIMTSTQLNSDYLTAQQYDQNLLRGAKSIADKIDVGMIMLQTSQEDKEALKPILVRNGYPEPDIKISVYKNRRGQYKDILLWCKSDRGACRIEPIFATNYQYQLQEIEDYKINVKPSTKITASAF